MGPCLGSDQQTQAGTGMHWGQGAKGRGQDPVVVPMSSAGAMGDWLEMGQGNQGEKTKLFVASCRVSFTSGQCSQLEIQG